MARRLRPPAATIRVADGTGGLRPLAIAAEAGMAPTVQRVIPSRDAADWMAHWHAVAELRGWSGGGLTQLEADQNAGSMSAHLRSGPRTSAIRCDWERERGADLHVRIRPDGDEPPPEALILEFVDQIEARLAHRVRESTFRRGWLTYEGLPWTGELWLGDALRLGPPSRTPAALIGSQAVVVDAVVQGIGRRGLTDSFATVLRELRLVLSPILGVALRDGMRSRQDWVPQIDDEHRIVDCRIQPVGYTELANATGLPARGATPALPLMPVQRPGLGPLGVWAEDRCIKVPDDIQDLWYRFGALDVHRRDQFLLACNAYAIARSMWPDQRTAYATFLVVAIEALKPASRSVEKANVYDVVATLLDRDTATNLKALRHPPQTVRSQQVHRGELRSTELASYLELDAFADPSFDEMLTLLSTLARQCLIEWLRRGGIDQLVWMPREKPARPRSPPKKSKRRTHRSRP